MLISNRLALVSLFNRIGFVRKPLRTFRSDALGRLFHQGVEEKGVAAHSLRPGFRGRRHPSRLGWIACHRIDVLDLRRHHLARGRTRRRLQIAAPAAASERQREKDEAEDGRIDGREKDSHHSSGKPRPYKPSLWQNEAAGRHLAQFPGLFRRSSQACACSATFAGAVPP